MQNASINEENNSMAQTLTKIIMAYFVCKRYPFDVSAKAVTMETTWFKSLPNSKAPNVHIYTNFPRSLTILDILNYNMAEFILRKWMIYHS